MQMTKFFCKKLLLVLKVDFIFELMKKSKPKILLTKMSKCVNSTLTLYFLVKHGQFLCLINDITPLLHKTEEILVVGIWSFMELVCDFPFST